MESFAFKYTSQICEFIFNSSGVAVFPSSAAQYLYLSLHSQCRGMTDRGSQSEMLHLTSLNVTALDLKSCLPSTLNRTVKKVDSCLSYFGRKLPAKET